MSPAHVPLVLGCVVDYKANHSQAVKRLRSGVRFMCKGKPEEITSIETSRPGQAYNLVAVLGQGGLFIVIPASDSRIPIPLANSRLCAARHGASFKPQPAYTFQRLLRRETRNHYHESGRHLCSLSHFLRMM